MYYIHCRNIDACNTLSVVASDMSHDPAARRCVVARAPLKKHARERGGCDRLIKEWNNTDYECGAFYYYRLLLHVCAFTMLLVRRPYGREHTRASSVAAARVVKNLGLGTRYFHHFQHIHDCLITSLKHTYNTHLLYSAYVLVFLLNTAQ